MIIFYNSSTSFATTAIVLTLILLSCIISSFLNPIIFFYNKKKTSIAGLLFCVLSATDFTICLTWPTIVLYYAFTIDLDKMMCREPQNCMAKATSTRLTLTAVMMPLNCTAYVTTGVLAIVRSVQIKYPFCHIKKFRVIIVLVVLVIFQTALWTFFSLSPLSEKFFSPSAVSAMAIHPYGESANFSLITAMFISTIPLSTIQIIAVSACIATAVTLFQQRNSGGATNPSRNRTAGTVKVLLTNLPSLTFTLLFASPISQMFKVGPDSESDLVTEKEGWMMFMAAVMFPLVSSVWNPLIFLFFTPKSVKSSSCWRVLCRRESGNEISPQGVIRNSSLDRNTINTTM